MTDAHVSDIEARAEAATPLSAKELSQALEELREIVNTSDPDEDKLLHFGLLRLLATIDALLAQLEARDKTIEAVSLLPVDHEQIPGAAPNSCYDTCTACALDRILKGGE